MEQLGLGYISAALVQGFPRIEAYGAYQRGGNFLGIVQRRVSKHLMQIGAVGFALLIGETVPASIIKLRQMGLVLSVDYMDVPATSNDDIRHQMSKRSMTRV